jgi:hypothetical protein
MAGTWLVNVILGTSVFLFTFIFTIGNNTWKTSAFRAGIGFILFFFWGYILRLVLNQKTLVSPVNLNKQVDSKIDAVLNNSANEEQDEDTSFQAIPLGSLHNGIEDKNPKTIADTIKSWASQNQEG